MTLGATDLPRPFRELVLPFVVTAGAATAVLALVVLIVPGRAVLALRWYLIIAGAIALMAAIRTIMARYPVYAATAFDLAARPRPAHVEPPARLREIERLVSYAEWDVVDFQARLRPILRQIAAHRLAVSRTVDIDLDPEAARAALGQRVWAILAPAEPLPDRRNQPIGLDNLRTVVEALEQLDDLPHD